MAQSPDDYIHGHHDSVLRSHRWRTAENSAAYLLGRLTEDDRVLDVGCGPGTITVGLATLVGRGGVVGVDMSREALANARAAAETGGRGNVYLEVGDVYRLGFPGGVFDVVHAHQVLQHLGDPVAALTEMRRVCRPGGTVAARDADYGAMSWFPEDPELAEWQALYRRLARSVGGDPDGGRHLHRWAGDAGFWEIETGESSWRFTTAEERAWWGGLWSERVTRSSFAHQAVARGYASPDDLARLADAWRRWASSEEGWFVVPNREIVCRN